MFGWLTDIMSQSLQFINGLVNNYGLSIIIFTLIIKFLLYPMTIKQTKSMKAMQDLQPELKKIQDKYKDDKQKQQEAMMKLYKDNNVNPAAGCLPMILTFLIIIPLYRAILNLDMGDSSFLWIDTLAEPDIALVIINGLAMVAQTFISQKYTAPGGQSNLMLWIMPIMIIFVGFSLPAGVLIYWLISTVFTVVQQVLINRDPDLKGVSEG
ncbi:MAG: YidC/Oxa1 family membrane protein insertase [Halanaerobiales bacterium]|nr:YidC/Oxa1 family membrane protein insertase [Halanaerobiales bacterium]